MRRRLTLGIAVAVVALAATGLAVGTAGHSAPRSIPAAPACGLTFHALDGWTFAHRLEAGDDDTAQLSYSGHRGLRMELIGGNVPVALPPGLRERVDAVLRRTHPSYVVVGHATDVPTYVLETCAGRVEIDTIGLTKTGVPADVVRVMRELKALVEREAEAAFALHPGVLGLPGVAF